MMDRNSIYNSLVNNLLNAFENRLKTVVLFGSQARGGARPESDYDVFLVIENLPDKPLERLRKIRKAIWDIPLRVNTIAKTPEELNANLTPLILKVCVDGDCLYGMDYFEPYREKAIKAINQSGLKRKRVCREWYWEFDKIPQKEWELTWEGFHELP